MHHHKPGMIFGMLFLPLGLFLLIIPSQAEQSPATCSYDTYRWNVEQRKAVEYSHVSHPYSELSAEEIDPGTGCTVCTEDQVELRVSTLPPFRVCRKLATDIEQAMEQLVQQGELINEVVGYRVGKTRGDVDAHGNRTRFSNHSYGIALDINPKQNGLYANCIEFGPQCRLIKGGPWLPDATPLSLRPDGRTVAAMRSIGLKWGGEIKGKQKDFMHFSISGY